MLELQLTWVSSLMLFQAVFRPAFFSRKPDFHELRGFLVQVGELLDEVDLAYCHEFLSSALVETLILDAPIC
jgi:hypothetical protein